MAGRKLESSLKMKTSSLKYVDIDSRRIHYCYNIDLVQLYSVCISIIIIAYSGIPDSYLPIMDMTHHTIYGFVWYMYIFLIY